MEHMKFILILFHLMQNRGQNVILRIVDKKTHLFIRDDFDFDEETEIGLDVEPAQGLYVPKWDGEKWIETAQAPEPTPQEPTELELLMLAVAELATIVTGG